jgi:hypothetical protein
MTLGRSRTSKYAVYNGLVKERRKICRILFGTYIAEKILGRQRRRCNDNMQLDLRETGCENGKWMYYLRMLFREIGCENGKRMYYLRMLSREMGCENGKWMYYLRMLSREMGCENGK